MASTSYDRPPALNVVPEQEEVLLREAVAGICSGFGQEYTQRKVAEDQPPTELWDALAERGYLGVNIPEEYDGGGLGMAALSMVGEEIAAAGCSLLLIVVSPAIAGSILARHGDPEQKDRWLRGIGQGTTKVAFAITEPDAGTNSHNLSTSLRRDGKRFLLNGQKTYISAVEHADAVLVVGRVRNADGQLGLPALAIVDVDAPGFTRTQIPMPNIGPDHQWQLFFEDVEVTEDRLVGGETGGLGAVFDGLNPERIMGASIAAGAGRLALAKASRLRPGAQRLGQADRHPSGRGPPAGPGQDRAGAGPADDPEGRGALRRRREGGGGGVEHGQVRRRRGRHPLRGPGDPDARRQRLRARVRAGADVVGRPTGAHGAGLARDGAQLRGRALAGPAEVLRAGLCLRMPPAANDPALPGADLVGAGLEDLKHSRHTTHAMLVAMAAPRLRACGIDVPETGVTQPSHELYDLLAKEAPNGAHSRYNALTARMVSYIRAAERARAG